MSQWLEKLNPTPWTKNEKKKESLRWEAVVFRYFWDNTSSVLVKWHNHSSVQWRVPQLVSYKSKELIHHAFLHNTVPWFLQNCKTLISFKFLAILQLLWSYILKGAFCSVHRAKPDPTNILGISRMSDKSLWLCSDTISPLQALTSCVLLVALCNSWSMMG